MKQRLPNVMLEDVYKRQSEYSVRNSLGEEMFRNTFKNCHLFYSSLPFVTRHPFTELHINDYKSV